MTHLYRISNLIELLFGFRSTASRLNTCALKREQKFVRWWEVIQPLDTKLFDARNFIRIQVSIDLSLPLCRGRLISLNDGKEVWVSFKYERLPNICYWCGCLTHDDKDCDLWIESEGTLRADQRAFGPYLHASPFVATRKNVIQVPGYYAEKKKTNFTTSSDRALGQPPQSGGAVVSEQPQVEEGSNANSFNALSMCNGFFGVKSQSETVTCSVTIPTNTVIIGDLLELDNLEKASNDTDEELRRVGRKVEAVECQNNPKAREVLSDAYETLTKPRAAHVDPRASSSNENRRILPGWTRRHREKSNPVQSQGQPILGQKRNFEEYEENNGVSAKCFQASQFDGHKNFLLVESDSQPHQQQ